MKTRILLLAGACALLPCGSASAALVIGFNSFTAGAGTELPTTGSNYVASGFSGLFNSGGLNRTATGGSSDQTYGDAVLSGTTLGINNGYISTYSGWSPFLELTNNSGSSVMLDRLLYDGGASPAATSVTIGYRYGNSGVFTDLVTTSLTTTYQSFSKDISSIQLNNGQTIQFLFAGGIGGQMDNFGITAVPEPSAALVAGGLLGLTALRRRRA